MTADRAVAAAAVAERFGYSRYVPSMSWSWTEATPEEARPGELGATIASHADRRGPDILDDARVVAARLVGAAR